MSSERKDIDPLPAINLRKLDKIDIDQRVKEIKSQAEEILNTLAIDREIFKKVYAAKPPQYSRA